MTPSTTFTGERDVRQEQLTKAPGLLERLGYAADEIHYGWLLSDGRMSVPAVLGDESSWLLIDTFNRNDLVLDVGRVTKWGWPYERTSEYWGRTSLARFFALGRTRPAGDVRVFGNEDAASKLYTTCGTLGAAFLRDSVVALDPIDTAVGISRMLDLSSRSDGAVGLPLVNGALDNLPITEALEDTSSLGARPRLIIDTNRVRSVISLEYILRSWPNQRRLRTARAARQAQRRLEWRLRVPELNRDVTLDAHVFERTSVDYARASGLQIDGYLGLDFLYRWLPVIDFRRWILWLAPADLAGA